MAAKEKLTTEVEPGPEDTFVLAPEPTGHLKAVVVAGPGDVPKADIVVVVETGKFQREPDAGEDAPLVRVAKKSNYHAGADVYLRYDPEVKFPADAAEVLTMGQTVQQAGFAHFNRTIGFLNVGPAHPAFAGANLAWQRGATDIVIVGLSDAEKEQLRPYFDALSNHAAEPIQVAVSFA